MSDITLPLSENDSPPRIAERLKGLVNRLFVMLDLDLQPNPEETYLEPWTKMFYVRAKQLNAHVVRIEYTLRCFITFLAMRLLGSETGRKAAQQAGNKPWRKPPEKRPYDVLEMIQEHKPVAGHFTMFSPEPSTNRKSYRHRYKYTPLDWAEVDVTKLILRIRRLPKALKNADKLALRLAASLLAGEFQTSPEASEMPRISSLASCDPLKRVSTYCPRFFRQVSEFYPPPEIMEEALEDERQELFFLHLHAGEAVRARI